MVKPSINYKFFFYTICTTCLLAIGSCKRFLDVEPPGNQISSNLVFADGTSATAAMAGVYNELYSAIGFGGGSDGSLTVLAGLSADELHNHMSADPQSTAFERNNVLADNENILSLWKSMYKSIYQVNAMIEGLSKSDITIETRNQLKGEALFVRAFCHFYLINCFGDIPLVLTTDYSVNASIKRSPINQGYKQIEADLLEAENLLPETYITQGRVRPNKFTATALLARIYLYQNQWERAEERATNIINKTGFYNLQQNLNSVFLANSAEAIWQLKPSGLTSYTNEGYFFGTARAAMGVVTLQVLNNKIVEAFEPNDGRLASWVTSLIVNGSKIYLPFKYKLQFPTGIESNEYSMVFRLAEQYLIRAESRAMQGKLLGSNSAASDVNIIRARAGLSPSFASNKEDLLLAIERERKFEFLAEWGHRWFDLKRRGRVEEVLASVKPIITPEDKLYPLPAQELNRNIHLRPQNPGY